MAPNSLLYTAELNFPTVDLDPFVEWYAYRHAPDLFKLGFKSCASYRGVEGGMDILDIYDMGGSEVFGSEPYRHMRVKDPYDAKTTRNVIEEAATIYSQRAVWPSEPAVPLLDADWISMVRFEAPASADGVILAWLAEEEGPRLARCGAARLRFGWRSFNHPQLPTSRPRCVILAEWPVRPPARFEGLEKRFGGKVTNIDVYIGYRLYPWADAPLNKSDGSPKA